MKTKHKAWAMAGRAHGRSDDDIRCYNKRNTTIKGQI